MDDKNLNEEQLKEVTETVDETVEIAEEKAAETSPDSAAEDEVKTTAGEIIADVMVSGASETEEAAEAEKTEALANEAEELSEEASEAVDRTVEIMEEKLSDLEPETAAAEEVQVEAGEIISDVLVAGADSEEAEKRDKELAEQAVPGKGPSVKEPPIIKKKKKLDKVNVIVIVICAVIVIACLLFVGFKLGWFKGKPANKMTLEDYSKIEVLKSDVEVSDEMVQQYIDNILQSESTKEEVKEGVVEDGDTLNIDYVGKLKSTGEVFDGGSATGQTLTIGSGQMIDGFESGLIGVKVGETKTVDVTFPEEYANSPDLAGQPASFDITVNFKQVTKKPELTDEFVKTYSANHLEKQLNTVDELKQYVYDYIYNYYLHTAMFEELQTKQTVVSYDEEQEAMLMDYTKQSLDYYAAMYGTTADQYASMYGAASADEYAKQEADYYLDTVMLVDKIVEDKKITWTEEEFTQAVALYMSRNGYAEQYTVEEFLNQSGETWKFLFENLEFKFDLAMKALEPNVVFVDQKESAEEVPEDGADVIAEPESAVEIPEPESSAAK